MVQDGESFEDLSSPFKNIKLTDSSDNSTNTTSIVSSNSTSEENRERSVYCSLLKSNTTPSNNVSSSTNNKSSSCCSCKQVFSDDSSIWNFMPEIKCDDEIDPVDLEILTSKFASTSTACCSFSFDFSPNTNNNNQFEHKTDLLRESAKEIVYPLQASPIFPAAIVSRKKLTSDDAKKQKYSIKIKVEGDFNFDQERYPGDSIYFICPNNEDEVNWLIKRLNLVSQADEVLSLRVSENTKKKLDYIPKLITIRNILAYFIDFRRIFSKILLRFLAHNCSSPKEKYKLLKLASSECSKEFESLILEPRLSLLDILHAFPSCSPPLDRLIELLPRLLPRPLSISSRTIETSNCFSFLYTLVDMERAKGRFYPRKGICTGYLTDLPLNAKIQVYAKKATNFRMIESQLNNKSIIMIGPGVGVAPFISFLENLEYTNAQQNDVKQEKNGSEKWLLFGCRNENQDFILKEKMTKFLKIESVTLTKLLVSFSQQQGHTVSRYVQDNIRLYGQEIADLMLQQEDNSSNMLLQSENDLHSKNLLSIFVCGDAKSMINDVFDAFVEVLIKFGGKTRLEAVAHLKNMQTESRYVQEAWS